MVNSPQVLDSWPLLAYFENQPAAPKVTTILKEAFHKKRDLLISSVNWGEILYVLEQNHGSQRREQIEHLMEQINLQVISIDKPIAREAALLKAKYKLGYADCFAGALAIIEKAELVTGDKDFKKLEDECKIFWI